MCGTEQALRDKIKDKRERLVAELRRYFGDICPALTARWEMAIVASAQPVRRELTRHLQALELVTNETSHELETAYLAAITDQESAEFLLDHALTSMEHLCEIAQAMTERLDELQKV